MIQEEIADMAENKGTDLNLTVGSPFKLIIAFAIPMILGNLLQQLYNFVDTIIVGRYLGVSALAGVGATSSINFLILGFCMGMCAGFAIPVAQMYGAGEYEKLRKYVANALYLSLVFSAVITVVVSILCRKILVVMDTPDEVIEYSYTYILTIFIGIPVTFLYNILSGIIRAIGDSKTPLLFLIVSTIINLGLDILFISQYGMGVFGAALATVLSQLISGILCMLLVVKKFTILHVKGKEWKPDFRLMGKLCLMGLPMGLQYSITAIGSVILQASVNDLGPISIAATTAASKVNMLFFCILDALGAAMATYSGQNLGAGRIDRIRKGGGASVLDRQDVGARLPGRAALVGQRDAPQRVHVPAFGDILGLGITHGRGFDAQSQRGVVLHHAVVQEEVPVVRLLGGLVGHEAEHDRAGRDRLTVFIGVLEDDAVGQRDRVPDKLRAAVPRRKSCGGTVGGGQLHRERAGLRVVFVTL